MQASVSIGTPKQASAKRVLLLGSGELGKEVAIALQRFGVEVHAADRYADAPAMQVAHAAHVLTMTDADALRSLIETVQPHLIVPEIEAIATEVLLAVEAQGITVVPSARATHLTMNREGIRRLAAETLGLPTSPYQFAHDQASLEAACQQIGFPCFIKPVMSSSGKGQSRLTQPDQVADAWQYAQSAGRVAQARVIVEGQIDFDFEITLLTVRALDPVTRLPQTYFCQPIGHRQVNGDYVESWQPQPMSPLALERAQHIADIVTTALGGCGLFGVELFVKDNEVWFSEVSPRPHDTGLVTLCTQYQNEFELHARAILGLPVDTQAHSPGASAVIYAGQDTSNLTFHHLEQALAIPGSDLRLFGKPEGFKKRRMGVALVRAENVQLARANADACSKFVKCNHNMREQ